jgi:hypothetical protein
MATGTLGTTASTGLTSLNPWNAMTSAADLATIAELIKKQGGSLAIEPGAFSNSGRLFLPGGRGVVIMKPGDYIGVDSYGWPIIVSSQSIAYASSSWSHNP